MCKLLQTPTLRGAKPTYYQQLGMIEWLEVPRQHFRLITGAAQKDVGKVVAGAKLKNRTSIRRYDGLRQPKMWLQVDVCSDPVQIQVNVDFLQESEEQVL